MVSTYGICCGILIALSFLFLSVMATPHIPLPFTSGVMSTGSMTPAINIGDRFFVDRTVSFSDVEVNDVAVFRDKEVFPISHRVIAHNGFEIVTKGDANRFEDVPITEDAYLGVVTYVIPTHTLGPMVGLAVGTIFSVAIWLAVPAILVICSLKRRACRTC